MVLKFVGSLLVTVAATLPAIASNHQGSTPSAPVAQSTTTMPVSAAARSSDNSRPILAGNNLSRFPASRADIIAYERALISGACLARSYPALSRDLLNAPVNSPLERSLLGNTSLSTAGCYLGGGGSSLLFLRGAIAESLLGVKRAPLEMLDSDAANALSANEDRRSRLGYSDDLQFIPIANCIVTSAPAETQAVLATSHGTNAELQALDRVLAQSPSCTAVAKFPRGEGPSFLRSYLAVAAFQLAQAHGAGSNS